MLINGLFINMFTHKKYILASSSNSRYRLLKNSGFVFTKVKPTCNEEEIKNKIVKTNKNPVNFAKKLSYEKAKSVSELKKYKDYYVIGCDTLVFLNNKIYDKAKNIKEAKQKLKKLSGKRHKIVSAVTICKGKKKLWECHETTEVLIRKLSSRKIDKYLSITGKTVLSSVGCYQIESLGPIIIEDIKGGFFNVMGLPLFKLLKYVTQYK